MDSDIYSNMLLLHMGGGCHSYYNSKVLQSACVRGGGVIKICVAKCYIKHHKALVGELCDLLMKPNHRRPGFTSRHMSLSPRDYTSRKYSRQNFNIDSDILEYIFSYMLLLKTGER